MHLEREEVQARVDSDEGDFGAVVGVGEAVERLEECSGGGSDHAGRDGRVGDIDDEDVDGRLRSADLWEERKISTARDRGEGRKRTMYSVGATNSTTLELSSCRA